MLGFLRRLRDLLDSWIDDSNLWWHGVPVLGFVFWATHTLDAARGFIAFQYGALAGADGVPRHVPPEWISTDTLTWGLALAPYALFVVLIWAGWSREKYAYDRPAEWYHAARFAVFPALAVLAALWYYSWEWHGLWHFLTGR